VSPRRASDHLRNYPLVFLRCRAWGHQWDEFQPLRPKNRTSTILSLLCERCSSERYDTLDYKGAVWARQYEYADGYAMTGSPMSRQEARAELLARSGPVGKVAASRRAAHRRRSTRRAA
jgi:hypothetical protein